MMASRGTIKALSNEQEEWVAKQYGGRRTKNSGASDMEKADVLAPLEMPNTLIECKMTGAPGDKPVRKTKIVSDLEIVADHAWAAGLTPALALRYFMPDSSLANHDGWVDITVRLTTEDAYDREAMRDGD